MKSSNNESDELIKKRIIELADRAYSTGVFCFTPFMGLAEQDVFRHAEKEFAHVTYTLFGGTEGCERLMARFGDEELCGYEAPFPIACIKAEPLSMRFADALTHRDLLGAIMNLGINRSTVGDIVVRDNCSYIFCTDAIAPYIIDNLICAKHTHLHLELIDGKPTGELYRLQKQTVNIASERLDCLVSQFLKVGRGEAAEIIARGRLFINGRCCESCSKLLKSGDIVSIRGAGRFIFKDIIKETRKGRLVAEIDRFI